MSVPLTLTKVSSQAAPYNWIWKSRGTRSAAGKYIGTTTFWVEGVDDTEVLRKVNGHEGERSALGKAPH